MKLFVEIDGQTHEVEVNPDGVRLNGERVEADLRSNHDSNLCHLVLDGRSYTLSARRQGGRGEWEVESGGRRHQVVVLDERRRAIRELAGSAAVNHGPVQVTAPMPGLIIKVEVEEGATVDKGHGLVIIEAMKMENELRATAAGRVAGVKVAAGQAVDKGDILLVIEPA